MKIGYVRVSKVDGSQVQDLQLDAMAAEGIKPKNIYADKISGGRDDRPGRSLRHLVNTVEDLAARGVGFKVLTGQGADIDTTTPAGKMIFGIFATLAEFERELNRERTNAGLASARARGRVGGRRHALTKSQVRQAQAAMGKPEIVVADLATELGVSKPTLYRYVDPDGKLREQGRAVLGVKTAQN